MKRWTALIAAGLLAACATPAPAPVEGRLTRETLDVGGKTRNYLLHDYSDGRRVPLVILLHGAGGSGENIATMSQFDKVAQREGLIAVYPDGTGGPLTPNLLVWNAGHCCGVASRDQIDDVGFVSALIDKLVGAGKADPRRVYVTGMSNGGMLTDRIGVMLAKKVAAIAPVVGGMFGDEPAPATPLPVLIVHGADDKIIPKDGGPIGPIAGLGGLGARAADRNLLPWTGAADYWARADGCGPSHQSQVPGAAMTAWSGCKAGTEVVFYVVDHNGHAWPGGQAGRAAADPPSQAFNASEVIWAFFKRHRR